MIKTLTTIICCLLITTTLQARATLINNTIDVSVTHGIGTGTTGTLLIAYDSDDVSNIGMSTLSHTFFDMTLNLFGQLFTESNDIDYPGYPQIMFENGLLTFVDFIIGENQCFGRNLTEIIDHRIGGISGGSVIQTQRNLVWEVTTDKSTSIPEPNIWMLLLLGVSMMYASRHFHKPSDMVIESK